MSQTRREALEEELQEQRGLVGGWKNYEKRTRWRLEMSLRARGFVFVVTLVATAKEGLKKF